MLLREGEKRDSFTLQTEKAETNRETKEGERLAEERKEKKEDKPTQQNHVR
jgi:hypothetical protein